MQHCTLESDSKIWFGITDFDLWKYVDKMSINKSGEKKEKNNRRLQDFTGKEHQSGRGSLNQHQAGNSETLV